MGFGAVKILDINGLSYLYTKLNNSIEDFQNSSKSIIESAAVAANSAADRANAIVGNADLTYATKNELKESINKITSFEFVIVTVLPSQGAKGTIYLMEHSDGNQSAAENVYDEYIWVGSKYEKIGTTDIDFSKYSTAQEIADAYLKKTDAVTAYATKGEVSTIDSKVDTNTTSISTHTGNTTVHITANERTAWNAAKTHADATHARTDATKVESSTTNGKIKINGTETTVYTHPTGTNPHGTTKSDIGLGNVGNFKAVSTVASQGLSEEEKANARSNIGAGSSSFSGSYNDLANKPTIGNGTVTIKQNGTEKAKFTMNQTGNTTVELTDSDTTYDLNTMINKLGIGESTPTDDDYYVSQYAGGGVANITYHRRPVSALYRYIKAKTDTLYAAASHTHTAANVGAIATTAKGAANGVASLDANGKVPTSQLPSYVDDVIEGYLADGKFYSDSEHKKQITGESGKIYTDLSTSKIYRWSGSAFAVISETLALGETSSTAYAGDKGKTLSTNLSTHTGNTTVHITANERTAWNAAKTHADATHARTDATKVESSTTNGKIKINGTETTVYTHPSGTNPHGTTKSDIGLGNVGNFKAVSTVASQGLSDAEKSNARSNIGAQAAGSYAAASHTHSYAGSASAGGSATSAVKLDTATAGTATKPVYFKDGKPTACTYSLAADVPSGAKFTDTTYTTGTASASGLTKLYTGTGTATDGTMTQAAIKTALDGKAASSHTHNYAGSSSAGGSATSAVKLATARTIALSGAVSGSASFDGSANITISTKVQYGTEVPDTLADGELFCVIES